MRLSRQLCQSSCPARVALVERVHGKQRAVELDHTFDHLFPDKLQQAYEKLVPDFVRVVGEQGKHKGEDNADDAKLCLKS